MFKPTLDVAERKESRSSRTSSRQRQKRDEVVSKKRELAERQAAAEAAARQSQRQATTGALVVPDAAMSNGAVDADLNSRIEEIEYDMQQTYEEFQNM
jgi:hypothetical protein